MLILNIDFDGTLVEHAFPEIGEPVPGALEWLRRFRKAGAALILWTCRSDKPGERPTLTEAVKYCRDNGIRFWGVNQNPSQYRWSDSPKAYAHLTIDDSAFGCPLVKLPGRRAYVDWGQVGPVVLDRLEQAKV